MQENFSRRTLIQKAALTSATGSLYLSNLRQLLAAERMSGTQLILLGTQGGPNFQPDRKEVGSTIVVNGIPYLIDCGYGVLGRLVESPIDYLQIPAVFLTHLHDDHVSDLPALMSHQWTQGRITNTEIFGPFGTSDMVKAALKFSQANTEIRMVDEGRQLHPEDLFSGHDIELDQGIVTVFEDERVKVTATLNTHYPDEGMARMLHRALSLRFDTADRSIVISGDTAYSENLIRLAKEADVLVCEAMQAEMMREIFKRMVASGKYQDNAEGILNHILYTHTTTAQAGQMAANANVGLLVLNHLIPGSLEATDDASYLSGVREYYKGPVIVGRDLQVL
jgi:ribonuclease BN (tRNA processing enzyme)